MLGGDPHFDRELQSEIERRSRRRDYLVLLGGFLVMSVIVLLLGDLQFGT